MRNSGIENLWCGISKTEIPTTENRIKLSPKAIFLLQNYKQDKQLIKKRLAEFKKVRQAGRNRLFAELCFCLCTPQSKAVNCDEAVSRLVKSGALFDGCSRRISKYLKGLVRFHNAKAKYIVEAREKFCNAGKWDRHHFEKMVSVPIFRQWLVKNIKGLGLKEASHFLRNIGLGGQLAIIDRHILTNLKRYGVINNVPQSISKKQYLELEKKMQQFSKDIKIPLPDLDLLFWSSQTGHIFK